MVLFNTECFITSFSQHNKTPLFAHLDVSSSFKLQATHLRVLTKCGHLREVFLSATWTTLLVRAFSGSTSSQRVRLRSSSCVSLFTHWLGLVRSGVHYNWLWQASSGSRGEHVSTAVEGALGKALLCVLNVWSPWLEANVDLPQDRF